ncbi:transcriptional regulator [Tilletia horrida]|nr:transcriptional regulator [Tilletia horrida]
MNIGVAAAAGPYGRLPATGGPLPQTPGVGGGAPGLGQPTASAAGGSTSAAAVAAAAAAAQAAAAQAAQQQVGGGGTPVAGRYHDDFPALGAAGAASGSGGAVAGGQGPGLAGNGSMAAGNGAGAGNGAAGGPSPLGQNALQHHYHQLPPPSTQQPGQPQGANSVAAELANVAAGARSSMGTGPVPELVTQTPAQQILASPADRFGLLGLLSVIRMQDPDLSMLALGNDLQNLGLNMSSQDALYSSLVTPWSENNMLGAMQVEMDYQLPSCYNVQPPPSAQSKINSFSDETLFFIFYATPRDVMQEMAAQELYNRNWRYEKTLQLWLTKDAAHPEPTQKTPTFERGTYVFFDPVSWEKVTKTFVLMYDHLEEKSAHMAAAAAAAAQAQAQARIANGQQGGSGAQGAQQQQPLSGQQQQQPQTQQQVHQQAGAQPSGQGQGQQGQGSGATGQ